MKSNALRLDARFAVNQLCSTARRMAHCVRLKIAARTVCCRCRKAPLKATTSSANIMGLSLTRKANAYGCPASREFTRMRAYGFTLSPSAIDSSGFGLEIPLADENKIPDLHWCSDPNWVFEGSTYHMKCNYQLLVDNLMDLSHETYVHPSSIGQHEIVEAPIKAVSDDRSVTVTRWMYNIDR